MVVVDETRGTVGVMHTIKRQGTKMIGLVSTIHLHKLRHNNFTLLDENLQNFKLFKICTDIQRERLDYVKYHSLNQILETYVLIVLAADLF